MFGLDTGTTVLLLVFLAAVLYQAGKWANGRYRRSKRVRGGARTEAVIDAVGPLDPPRVTEHPFMAKYLTPSGTEHVREFHSGFNGIVPTPGWRLRVLFDPVDPSNAEIEANPYLHPIAGAPAPKNQGGALPGWLLKAVFAMIGGAFVSLFVLNGMGSDLVMPVFGFVFATIGLVVAVGGFDNWRSQSELRASAVPTTARVTHSWEKRVSSSSSSANSRGRSRVYPYTVLYTVADGRQVHRKSPVATSNVRHTPGQEIEIFYDPSDPTRFAPSSQTADTTTLFLAGGLGTLFFCVGMGIMLVGLL